MKNILLVAILLISLGTRVYAKDIYVKYRGSVDVDNGHFSHLQLKSSSLVKDMYYDKNHEYLLVRLKHTYYHYCSIPNSVINKWIESPSLGRYYNSSIRGNYDCRVNPAPNF